MLNPVPSICFAVLQPCRDILRAQAGLAEHHDNYHEFCRLLGRLKTNYQLSELVRAVDSAFSVLIMS
jgi:hypothetical protein